MAQHNTDILGERPGVWILTAFGGLLLLFVAALEIEQYTLSNDPACIELDERLHKYPVDSVGFRFEVAGILDNQATLAEFDRCKPFLYADK